MKFIVIVLVVLVAFTSAMKVKTSAKSKAMTTTMACNYWQGNQCLNDLSAIENGGQMTYCAAAPSTFDSCLRCCSGHVCSGEWYDVCPGEDSNCMYSGPYDMMVYPDCAPWCAAAVGNCP
jgi:hypothetical protein